MEDTHLVSCTISTQPFQVPMTWVIHNICCDFNFSLENKIHCIYESIKFIWFANDLNIGILFSHIPCGYVAHSLSETMYYKLSLFHQLAFIKNALWEDISILNTSHYWTKTLLPNCHLWFDRSECFDTLPRTFGLDPAYDNFDKEYMSTICGLCTIDSMEQYSLWKYTPSRTLSHFPRWWR
jgi:hypothetical protein